MRGALSLTLVWVLLHALPALACESCRPAVRAGIFNEHFAGRLLLAVLPFLATLVVVGLVGLFTSRPRPVRQKGAPG